MITVQEKLQKRPSGTQDFYLNLASFLGEDTISGVLDSSLVGNSMTLDFVQVISLETTVYGTTIPANKGLKVRLTGGTSRLEYKLVVDLLTAASQNHRLVAYVLVGDSPLYYYGSAWGGDDYFATRLGSTIWDGAEIGDRVKALVSATRAIDSLNFDGVVATAAQKLQFPRVSDVQIPQRVEWACYEEALALLDEADPQEEYSNLFATQRGISSVRTTYDRSAVPENVAAGITSHLAWRYLVPFLRDPGELSISRV